ncbi:MAG: molybdopterin converting factor subunit 1 [Burkholderiales bacterium]|nr:molybdopterin converting factor subunit 1 [Burkholderiales bacterium]
MTDTIRVLYFASVREKVGCDAEEIELPAGVTTIAALRAHLRARGGPWAEALGESRALRAAVNQEMVPPTAAVRPGDEVAFFPPVTGG